MHHDPLCIEQPEKGHHYIAMLVHKVLLDTLRWPGLCTAADADMRSCPVPDRLLFINNFGHMRSFDRCILTVCMLHPIPRFTFYTVLDSPNILPLQILAKVLKKYFRLPNYILFHT